MAPSPSQPTALLAQVATALAQHTASIHTYEHLLRAAFPGRGPSWLACADVYLLAAAQPHLVLAPLVGRACAAPASASTHTSYAQVFLLELFRQARLELLSYLDGCDLGWYPEAGRPLAQRGLAAIERALRAWAPLPGGCQPPEAGAPAPLDRLRVLACLTSEAAALGRLSWHVCLTCGAFWYAPPGFPVAGIHAQPERLPVLPLGEVLEEWLVKVRLLPQDERATLLHLLHTSGFPVTIQALSPRLNAAWDHYLLLHASLAADDWAVRSNSRRLPDGTWERAATRVVWALEPTDDSDW